MIAPRCASCGRTVLELRGQFAVFDSFLISNHEPPPDTAGAWHIPCLERSDVGPRWHAAVVRSLVDVRRHTLLGRAEGWAAVRAPTGEPIAISPHGAVLPLRYRDAKSYRIHGGLVVTVHEPEYNLELRDSAAIAKLQEALRAERRVPLAAAAGMIGIADTLVRPELQADAALLVQDADAVDEWTKHFVCTAMTYSVFIPDAMSAFLTD